MLRLDVGIGDGGIELDPIPNQPGFGNRIQYQIQFNSEQIRGSELESGGVCRVEYRLEFGGFPIPNTVTIQTPEFGFVNSNSEFRV
jgi:hypothetical protein